MNAVLQPFDEFGPVLWRSSWQAAVLALAVGALLAVARDRIAPRGRFLCWSVVFVRLLVPVLPEAHFSLFNLCAPRPTTSNVSKTTETGRHFAASPIVATSSSPPAGESVPGAGDEPQQEPVPLLRPDVEEQRPAAAPPAPAAAAPADPIRWTGWRVGGLVWAIGFLAFSSVIVSRFIRLSRQSRHWHPVTDLKVQETFARCLKRMGVRRSIGLLLTADCGPAVVGLWRPAVLLPERLLSDLPDEEIGMILLHESAHLRWRDIGTQWLAIVARAMHWFNPVAWLALARWQAERELGCDEAVLAVLEPPMRIRYGELLVRLAHGAETAVPAPGLLGTIGTRMSLTRRLEMIRDYRPRARASALLAGCALAALALFGLTDAPLRSGEPDGSSPGPRATGAEAATVAAPSSADGAIRLAQATAVKPPVSDDSGTLREGWQRQVTIPEFADRGAKIAFESRLTLRVEQGWLIVRRTTLEDDLEWEVVLARATDPKRPEIRIENEQYEVRYRDYVIREGASGWLRIFREKKSKDAPAWPWTELERRKSRPGQEGFVRPPMSLQADDWLFTQSGPTLERLDFRLRFRPADWRFRMTPLSRPRGRPGTIATIGSDGAPTIFGPDILEAAGKTIFLDDGDLIIAKRITFAEAAMGLDAPAMATILGTANAPALEGGEWLNAPEGPPSLEKLRGRVVLLGFFDSELPLSVRQLPELQRLHRDLADRGVRVIGVHDGGKVEEVAALLKEHGVTFPVLIDERPNDPLKSAPTAARYGVDARPMHFLIDVDGQAAWGWGSKPPVDEIERVLFRDVPAPEFAGRAWLNSPGSVAVKDLRDKVVLLMLMNNLQGPRNAFDAVNAFAARVGHRDFVVVGAYRAHPQQELPPLLVRNGIAFPVMTDADETFKRYHAEGTFLEHYFLIDREGKLVGGRRGALPEEAEVRKLLK